MNTGRRQRGSLPDKITLPEEAVAISKCLVHRMTPPREWDVTGKRLMPVLVPVNHPGPCRYESYPTDLLLALVMEFNESSGLNAFDRWSQAGSGERPSVNAQLEVFMAAPRVDQAELVRKAQGYE